jgi:tetratricopeptide (TPR) repeat protein
MVLLAHEFKPASRTCFEQAESLDPHNVRWPYLRGMSVLDSDGEAAIDSFQRAQRLRTDLPVIHDRLAELLMEAGRYDEAEDHWHASRRLQPDEIRPLVGLARVALLGNRLSEARQWAQQAGQRAPDRRPIHELLANVYQRQGEREAAVRESELAATLPDVPLGWNDPFADEVLALRQDAWRHVVQGKEALSQQRTAEAIRHLQLALQEDERDPSVHCMLARALMQAGRLDDALQVLDRALVLHPASAEVRFQRGVAFYFAEDFQQAEQMFRDSLAIKPDYALAHYNLGHALEHLGDSQAALESFQAAARYRPTHAASHANAGRILWQLGRTTEARQQLEIAVRMDPDDSDARRLLEETRTAPPQPRD